MVKTRQVTKEERRSALTTVAADARGKAASGPSRPKKTPRKKGKSTIVVEEATDATNAMVNKCLEVENAQRDKKLDKQEKLVKENFSC